MPAVVTCGATLVKKLAETGTGDNKLNPCRQRLREISLRDKGRIATADEVLEVLEESAPPLTIAKAKTIMQTGEWTGEAGDAEPPIEVALLGENAINEWRAQEAEKLGRKRAAAIEDENRDRKRMGMEPKEVPGVHPTQLQDEKNTVGPKRVK